MGEQPHQDPGSAPLAARMRPRTLAEVVGQRHLVGPGKPLTRLAEGGGGSVVLWGPPGVGKTTLALLLAEAGGKRYVQLSAVDTGVKQLREAVEDARRALEEGVATVLFVDEVHRFSKTQQDALLAAVEHGWVQLVAATTENPSFALIAPLMSRTALCVLEPLTEDDMAEVVQRAIVDERGLDGRFVVGDDGIAALVRASGGDARRALVLLEAAVGAAEGAGRGNVEIGDVESAGAGRVVVYDRDGDQHYDIASAFIKSMRGSDVDAALYWMARMLHAGEDPRFLARRVVIAASEDVGMADPSALQAAVAAAQAVALLGMPEARITLAQAVVHVTLAPKSNAVYQAVNQAFAAVAESGSVRIPAHLRDSHYPGAGRVGAGTGYVYPHEIGSGVAAQQYLPDELSEMVLYRPTERGVEAKWGAWHHLVRPRIRGEGSGSGHSSS